MKRDRCGPPLNSDLPPQSSPPFTLQPRFSAESTQQQWPVVSSIPTPRCGDPEDNEWLWVTRGQVSLRTKLFEELEAQLLSPIPLTNALSIITLLSSSLAMRPDEDSFLPTITSLNSPLILDMGESLQDTDLEFFTSPLTHESPVNGHSLEANFLASSPTARSLHPDLSSNPNSRAKQHQVVSHPLSETGERSQPRSTQSSVSPETSSQDSSSDSSRRYKRKTSSNSSQSAAAVADTIMTDVEDANVWKSQDLMVGGDDPSLSLDSTEFPSLGGLSDPLSMEPDYEFSNKAMENHFDFASAASSPSPFDGGVPFGSNSIGTSKVIDVSYQGSRRPGNKFGYNARMLPVSSTASARLQQPKAEAIVALASSRVRILRAWFSRSLTFVGNGHESGVLPVSFSGWPFSILKFQWRFRVWSSVGRKVAESCMAHDL